MSQENGVYKYHLKSARAKLDTFWRAGNDPRVSPFEESGTSSRAGIGAGSAAIEMGADDAAPLSD